MKKISLFLTIILLSSLFLKAQDTHNEDGVVKLDPLMCLSNCVPNEVLLKFKTGYEAHLQRSNTQLLTGMLAVDAVLAGYTFADAAKLLPNETAKRTISSTPSFTGQDIPDYDLSQLYILKLDGSNTQNHYQLIEALKALPEVEFAEPNYIVSALGNPIDEPMYSLQWGIPAVKLNNLWTRPILPAAQRKVIAIIDTGVDITHPDLEDNIWTNAGEVGGIPNYDNDGNGFNNDLHGWDFVNNTPNMNDFNSHGTHCAGLAAAPANGIGITGANPNAFIMPLTGLQSNGSGDVATLIKCINYAKQNGADVISMSWGTYTHSIALEQALAQAYQTCVLVAAAGNDGLGMLYCCQICRDMFPAAFTFVLGVQASDQSSGITPWSNYDCTGPVYTVHNEEQLYNYELLAPGQGIISTVPGGSYRAYNGTSMAAPLVAGGVSALLDRKEFASQEMLWATLIQSAFNTVVDFNAAYSYTPQPELNVVAIEINDTIAGDGDMRPDAGELIHIYPTIRNSGGQVNNIRYKIEFAQFEDTSTATIIDQEADFGYTLSAYAKMKALNPIKIQIDSNVVDGRIIKMVLKAWYGNNQGMITQPFELHVENGVELSGMLMQDMTLYPNVHYIVTNNFAIPAGVKLTIKPGTVIKIKENVTMSSNGTIKAIGTPDSLITFTKTDLGVFGGNIIISRDTLKYCNLEYNRVTVSGTNATSLYNCVLSKFNYLSNVAFSARIQYSNFFYCNGITATQNTYNYNNYVENTGQSGSSRTLFTLSSNTPSAVPRYNNIFSNHDRETQKISNISDYSSLPVIFTTNEPSYWGSSIESIARKGIFDFYTPNSGVFGVLDLSNMATRPYAQAHGIVWKVVVNGYDAQDKFDQLPPLGVGKHKFEVYFNRLMDTTVTPMVAMGARPPYTQNAIAEDGSWSWNEEDSCSVYTAWFTVKAATATDGLNRIYVANAQDDEYFEIPFENQRFNVIVQSAGSLSSGFMATPGMGKVMLEWESPEDLFDDFLGFNMYRYTWTSDTTTTDTLMINTTLITDTLFTDFDVAPGQTYCYTYKVMRTNLTENDFSRVVSAVPFTAAKGDANGDMSINVSDIVTTVNHIIGGNPQPFIFEAADVNSDGFVNVLDIVGIVNLILNPGDPGKGYGIKYTASFSIEDGILYVESSDHIGGLQFLIRGDRKTANIRPLKAIGAFEKASQWLNDSTYMLLVFSMSGQELEAGKNAILQLENATLLDLIISTPTGENVTISNGTTGIDHWEFIGNRSPLKLYPNPFHSSVNIVLNLEIPDNQKVEIIITDVLGRVIEQSHAIVPGGVYEIEWKPKSKLTNGVYFCQLRINNRVVATGKVVYQE